MPGTHGLTVLLAPHYGLESCYYRKLMDLLVDGQNHDMTVSINNINDDTDSPIITALPSRSWVCPEDEPDTLGT